MESKGGSTMGEIRNCPRCGKIFNYLGRPICGRCMQAEEEEFKKVKEYIYDYPGSNMPEISDATEVSIDKIMRFLREERLEISGENPNMFLECERCEKSIKTGRFCDACKDDLEKGFKQQLGASKRETDTSTSKSKMYTATRRK
jgi:flagellar operon protein (TIGR03826 family)